MQQLARKQRRARRTPSYVVTAGITAPAATSGQQAEAAAAAAAATEAAQELDVQPDEDPGAAAADTADADEGGLAVDGEAGNGCPAGSHSDPECGLPVNEEELQQLQLVQLSCQEAFFLAHVLNCCSVFVTQQDLAQEGQQQQQQQQQQQLVAREKQSQAQEQQQQQQQQQVQGPLAPAELWRWCCSAAPGGALQFVSRYAAYKHFRSKGWLPLPGLLYGADYALYKLHPEWAHSDFLVMVMRLARQVLKQLLLLYVVIPQGLELGSLECMQQLTVREVLLQRWVPSEHREDGKA
ncbi:hypothetical protein OEZ86_000552 [Tetradesmus obliquus]|nr:hypothetical protein OEZ86_000552 [Tetradesmus obliquus]